MNNLVKSFDTFFNNPEAKVAVIKGDWGVGKTYFWENYIDEQIKERSLSQAAYSYISLFGQSSLDTVKQAAFHNAKPIKNSEEIEAEFEQQFDESQTLLDKAPWLKKGANKAKETGTFLQRFMPAVKELPLIKGFSGTLKSLEYKLVNNYVICFDDLERKNKGLAVKEVMGLIDELAQRKECKIVLIFNDKSLESEDEIKQFESYREKVVDFEVTFNPSCIDNMKCIFKDDFVGIEVVEKVVRELDIKNIRVLRKLQWLINEFSKHLLDCDDLIAKEFHLHASLLCWAYYIGDKDLPYETLKVKLTADSWFSLISSENGEEHPSDKRYNTIATNLEVSNSVFGSFICSFLENGYFDETGFLEQVENLKEKIKVNNVNVRLRKAWDIYGDSFNDNLNELTSEIEQVLTEELERCSFNEFASVADLLEEFNVDISGYVDRYLELNKNKISDVDIRHSSSMRQVKSAYFLEKVQQVINKEKSYSIDEVSSTIAYDNGWSREHTDFLFSLSKDDFKIWMKGDVDDLTTKVRSGLLIFSNIQTSGQDEQEKYNQIGEKVVAALKEIAAENELNRKRVKLIYGISIDD
jgi:hypothetical protein